MRPISPMKLGVHPDVLLHAVQECNRTLSAAELNRWMDALLRGVSPCCGKGIDEEKVEPRGIKRGRGKRFCMHCKKELFKI